MPSVTGQLVDWAASVSWATLPSPIRRATNCRVVDSVGLMMAGSDTVPGRAVRDHVLNDGGAEQATLLGQGRRLPAASVALVHGTWAHVHDFDDTQPETVIHPTSPVVATALAVGEANDCSPEQILTAVAVGVEVMCRLGVPAGRRFHHRGFHPTGLLGPIASAMTAATLSGASNPVVVDAMGLAGSMSSGLLAFLGDGSWSKRMHPGWAAHGGVVAAALAGRGFLGPDEILEDRFGVYAAFLHGDEVDSNEVVDDLGAAWRSDPPHFKRYPCAHVIQPFLDAVLNSRLDAHSVDQVTLRVPAWQVPIVCEPWQTKIAPATEYQARTSLPFAVASAIVDRDVGVDTFAEDRFARPELRQMLERLRYELGDELEDFEAEVVVRCGDGTTTTLRPPSKEPPMDELMRIKLSRTAGRVLDAACLDALFEAVAGDDLAFDVVHLVRCCRMKSDGDIDAT